MNVPPSANTPSLSLESFQDIVDQFGENSAHWPESQRIGALALLEASPAARAIVDEARQMRSLLTRRPTKAPDHVLAAIHSRLTPSAESVVSVQRVRVRS